MMMHPWMKFMLLMLMMSMLNHDYDDSTGDDHDRYNDINVRACNARVNSSIFIKFNIVLLFSRQIIMFWLGLARSSSVQIGWAPHLNHSVPVYHKFNECFAHGAQKAL